MRTALIVGVAGTQLSRDEAAFLKDAQPAGFILFARNSPITRRSARSSPTCGPRSAPTICWC